MHRDAALRNVLLKADFTVRLADFGLSRQMDESGSYCCEKDKVDIPYRHVAPEVLRSGRFSIKSEYWSFGVVLWELFTFAKHKPYADEFDESNLHNMTNFFEQGERLRIPITVPQPM